MTKDLLARLANLVFVNLCLCIPMIAQTRPIYYSIVRIEAFTSGGNPLDSFAVNFEPIIGTDEKFSSTGNKFIELKIPTGIYRLTTRAPGFENRSEVIRVYSPKVLHTVAFPPVIPHVSTYVSLLGKVENYEGNFGNLRVRLMALFGNEVQESSVEPDGSFQFPGADQGAYLLVTLKLIPNGAVILDSQPVRLAKLRLLSRS